MTDCVFDSYIDDVMKKMASKCGVLTRLRNDINLEGQIELYNTLIRLCSNFCRSMLFLAFRNFRRFRVVATSENSEQR